MLQDSRRSRGSDPAWVRVEANLSISASRSARRHKQLRLGATLCHEKVAKELLHGDSLMHGQFEQCWSALVRTVWGVAMATAVEWRQDGRAAAAKGTPLWLSLAL